MDDTEETTFANRDDPIPILRIPLQDDSDATSENEHGRRSKRESLKSQADKIKSKFEDVKEDMRSGSIQERLLNNFMAQIIPPEDGSESVKDRRSRAYVDRPSFSLPMMSSNFRRFNSRIGIVFVFQNQLIRLFTWKTPTHTLSFLAAYTLICLEPALIPAMPLALIFFFVMIPSFLVRHPPPPYPTEGTLQSSPDLGSITEMESAWSSYAYTAAPVAPARKVRPAPEMSKDFFRNMRDLQNSMEDFSRVHDTAIAVITPYTNFSDEQLSSSVFLVVFVLMNVALISSHLVPWRLVAVIAGWSATCAGHARAQDLIYQARKSRTLKEWQHTTQTWVRRQIEYDIALYEPPEIREVEVFELQRRQNRSNSLSMRSPTDPYHDRNNSDASEATEEPQSACDADDENWEAWLFTPSPHDPLCPQRLSGAWPTGTQFFEEVHPPQGWIWKDKKWTLDLLSEAWVEERCVTGVEVEREGGRWVYDIGYAEEYGQARKKKSKKDKSWEEGMNRGKKGEWRRRRWVRLVERKAIKVSEVD